MEPIKLDRNQVMSIIPHRDPMLLIDEVTEMIPGETITATFYVDPDREIFKGHFPGDPVLPGVYTTEIMAQAADILLMTLERYKGKTPLFLGINNIRFLRKITPGETLLIKVKVTAERPEKAIITCTGEVSVSGQAACTGDVSLAMR